MKFILIIMFFADRLDTQSVTAATSAKIVTAVTSAEFDSLTACETAGHTLRSTDGNMDIRWQCFPKE